MFPRKLLHVLLGGHSLLLWKVVVEAVSHQVCGLREPCPISYTDSMRTSRPELVLCVQTVASHRAWSHAEGEADPYLAPKLLLLVPTPAILQTPQAACSIAALSTECLPLEGILIKLD